MAFLLLVDNNIKPSASIAISITMYRLEDFVISSNTLNSILYGMNTDYDEVPNEVIIYTDVTRNVNKITFNLDSLCRNNKICNYGLKINLEYDMFGEVEGIINPMDN